MENHGRAGGTVIVEGYELGPYLTNCYLVRIAGARDCWIVDAGFEPGEMIERARGLVPRALLLTHAHADHIAGVREVKGAFPGIPVLIHEAEQSWLGDPLLNLSALGGMAVTAPGPDGLLRDGDTLGLAGTAWRVIHTPGHSPGGISLHCPREGLALVGDALFAGSVGRTDFPGSDPEMLADSIRRGLYTLPDETRIYPGHGPPSTIGEEKRTNPFVRA